MKQSIILSENINRRLLFWLVIFTLLLLPLVNSVFVSVKKLLKGFVAYNEYKKMVYELNEENKTLSNQLKYYKSDEGFKNLIKNKLNRVEKGELLIKVEE